jgi:imidazole glycerol-phosphate synthase subunit HisF
LKRRIRIIPCLLLRNGRLVKSVKFAKHKYIGDPINTVKIFNEKGADELVILDIGPSRDNQPIDFSSLEAIASEAFMPLAYGGGIKTLEDAKRVFDLGYEKIVINTAAARNPSLLRKVADVYGNQSVVASVDVKKGWLGGYSVYNCAGTRKLKTDVIAFARSLEAAGAGEIFLTAIDREGTYLGYDLELTKLVSQALTIPVIASGGAGSLEHMKEAVIKGGAHATSAGSFFVFQKKGMGVLISFPKDGLVLT